MTWAEFLTAISESPRVTLVGPLYNQTHTPQEPTIYVDGGSRSRVGGGWASLPASETFCPAISVGDGDSSSGKLDELLPAAKDYSDLAFALRHLPSAVRHVTLLGFLGGRRDHELSNLGEVHAFLKARTEFAQARLPSPRAEVLYAFNRGHLELEIRGTFSVLALEPAMVRIVGDCRYPLEQPAALAPLSSHGLSNVGAGSVRIEALDQPVFVITN